MVNLKQDLLSYMRNKEEMSCTADVAIVLPGQGAVLQAHRCILSHASPVLKEILMSMDLRLDKMVYIILEGVEKETVISFLQFVYNGSIGFDKSCCSK